MRARAAETKNKGQSEMEEEEESLIMHMWKQIMQLEITEAVKTCVFIHNC